MPRRSSLTQQQKQTAILMHSQNIPLPEIVRLLDASYMAVYRLFNNATGVAKPPATAFRKAEPPPPIEPSLTTDADGRTVKRYPSRFAEGCGISGITAKPRGK